MVDRLSIILTVCMLCAAYTTLVIKSKTEDVSFQLNYINNLLKEEKVNLHVAKTELIFLTSSQNIKKLADTYLDLHIPTTSNFLHENKNEKIEDKSLYGNAQKKDAFDLIKQDNGKTKVKWKYKDYKSKNIHHISR